MNLSSLVAELVFKQLEGHLHDCQCEHLELSLCRLKEHQAVISTLHGRIGELETTVAQQQTTINTLQAGAAASVLALTVHEKRQDKAIKDAMYAAEQKASRRSAEVSADLHGEITKLKKAIQDIARASGGSQK